MGRAAVLSIAIKRSCFVSRRCLGDKVLPGPGKEKSERDADVNMWSCWCQERPGQSFACWAESKAGQSFAKLHGGHGHDGGHKQVAIGVGPAPW